MSSFRMNDGASWLGIAIREAAVRARLPACAGSRRQGDGSSGESVVATVLNDLIGSIAKQKVVDLAKKIAPSYPNVGFTWPKRVLAAAKMMENTGDLGTKEPKRCARLLIEFAYSSFLVPLTTDIVGYKNNVLRDETEMFDDFALAKLTDDDIALINRMELGARLDTSIRSKWLLHRANAIGCQYHSPDAWFVFNRIHDCEVGIIWSGVNGSPVRGFAIGNIIYNLATSLYTNNTGAIDDSSAIVVRGCQPCYIIGNTIFNVEGGVHVAVNRVETKIENNIIAGIRSIPRFNDQFQQTADGGVHLRIDSPSTQTTVRNCLFFQMPSNGNGYNIGPLGFRARWGSQSKSAVSGNDSFQALDSTGALLAGSLDQDPLFVSAIARDLHLEASSPAISSGLPFSGFSLVDLNGVDPTIWLTFTRQFGNAVTLTIDADGVARPTLATAKWHMGAYQRQ